MKYFKQAWNLIKQEKLFSSIYIIGTGLSITMVMVLSIVYYIKIANIYPETNRDRILVAKSGVAKTDDSVNSSSLSYNLIDNCFRHLKNVETVAAEYEPWRSDNRVQIPNSKQQLPVSVKYVDDRFWKVFSFRFTGGKPFTSTDVQSGIRTAVISESLSKKLFGTVESAGKDINMNFDSYRISGVVKDVSYATENSYAQMWIPYSITESYKNSHGPGNLLGQMKAYILVSSAKELDVVKNEVIENVKRYNTNFPDVEFSMLGQPDKHWQSIFRKWSNEEPDFTKIIWQYGLIFFILLFVPAVSLSGMTDSRMERRLSEMGIRRAFGAPRTTLMTQIISENFFFTLLGGVVGLLLSYLLLFVTRDWILQIGSSFIDIPPEGTHVTFSPSMLINIPVFLIALLVCFILNLLSALIPAWRASNQQIISSLNAK